MDHNKFESNGNDKQESKYSVSKRVMLGLTTAALALGLMTGCGDTDANAKPNESTEPKTEQTSNSEEIKTPEIIVDHGEGWDKIPEVDSSENFSIVSEIAKRNNEDLSPELEKLSSITVEEFLDNDITTQEQRDIFYNYIENGMKDRINALQDSGKTDLDYHLELSNKSNIYDKIIYRANVVRLMTAWDSSNEQIIYDKENAMKYATRIMSLDKRTNQDSQGIEGVFSGIKTLQAAKYMIDNITEVYINLENNGDIDENVSSFGMELATPVESINNNTSIISIRSSEDSSAYPNNFLTSNIIKADGTVFEPTQDFRVFDNQGNPTTAFGFDIYLSNGQPKGSSNESEGYNDTITNIIYSYNLELSQNEKEKINDNEVHAGSESKNETQPHNKESEDDSYWESKINEYEKKGFFKQFESSGELSYSEKKVMIEAEEKAQAEYDSKSSK
ncbi:MAG: hypothetical protein WAX68_07345 [Streptococcus suis]